ncbi:hypothetical protein EDC96DRAFT_581180 [Choanephora cucurbitarum]|nr:hypothetical protein EDC96DRAFT_581180 [Choanephora cucurbitarum]
MHLLSHVGEYKGFFGPMTSTSARSMERSIRVPKRTMQASNNVASNNNNMLETGALFSTIQPSTSNNIAFKRRLETDANAQELESGYNQTQVFEASTSDSLPRQVRRGRPKKAQQVSVSTSELPALGESMISASANSSSVLNEFDHAMEALQLRVRPSTATIYRMPLAHWKEWCDLNRHRFPVDLQYPYTVGPTEFVIAFFKEFVFKRTCKKSVMTNSEV